MEAKVDVIRRAANFCLSGLPFNPNIFDVESETTSRTMRGSRLMSPTYLEDPGFAVRQALTPCYLLS